MLLDFTRLSPFCEAKNNEKNGVNGQNTEKPYFWGSFESLLLGKP